MAGTNHLAMEGAPLHGASQHPDPPRGVSNGKRPHSGIACAPELFHFRRSELRWPQWCTEEAAGRGSAWKSHNLHFSNAGSREFGPTGGLRSVNSCWPCNAASASRWLSFPSAANESAICNLTLHSAKDQRYNQFCRMHNVLDPKSTSVNVAGRRAERRGPKTCLPKIEDVESVGSLCFAARFFWR